MTLKDFVFLCISFVACIVFIIGYHLHKNKTIQHEEVFSPTQYTFQTVEGPIQPLPKELVVDKKWARLGEALFHSTLLSKENDISCASCHFVNEGGDDGLAISIGHQNQSGTRNSPTVLNAVFNFRQFWDGRAASLAEQMDGPIHNPVEMATSWQEVIEKLNKDSYYRSAFYKLSPEGINQKNMKRALVTYLESLITPDAAFDRYLLGDQTALNEQQKRGWEKFQSFGCITCHQGVNIGGNFYQKLGRVDLVPEKLLNDKGLQEFTKQENHAFLFKVPSLRNVAKTAPYFHNGTVKELQEAIRIMGRSQLGMELADQDVADIEALLHSFSGELMSQAL
ncbi:cytochrome-c peroxidase [Algicola sagamiensis]|uniref:cytochrome-c peroxidase n=1 Tax=Algicola sagamiensis TaxID=163869 RepID=UPI0003638D91|nr:cytochrome c peroxidase [Algicola sagamiensis]